MNDVAREHWTRELPEGAFIRLKELHEIRPWRLLKILALFGMSFPAVLVAALSDSMWVQVSSWVFTGLCLHGLGVFMHEGAHLNLTRQPVLDRLIGFVCGLAVGISCSNYRVTHNLHHRFENTDADPDNMAARFPTRVPRSIVYYAWFLIGTPVYAAVLCATGPFRAETIREKAVCLLETVLIVGFFWMMATSWLETALLHAWLGGLAAASLIANVRALSEHTLLPLGRPPNPFWSTRSVVSNAVIRFFFNNQNYHLEHHLFPRVPWYNLPEVHHLLRATYRVREAAVCPGYRDYLYTAARRGPMHETRYTDGHVGRTPRIEVYGGGRTDGGS